MRLRVRSLDLPPPGCTACPRDRREIPARLTGGVTTGCCCDRQRAATLETVVCTPRFKDLSSSQKVAGPKLAPLVFSGADLALAQIPILHLLRCCRLVPNAPLARFRHQE